jgi:acyl-CoA synthetase (AMP-forming)/AMP-acid ligase II
MKSSSAFETKALAELIAQQSSGSGDAIALHWAGKRMTFRELDQRANRIVHALLRSGTTQRVAVLGRDTAESLAILFGAAKARLTVTFLNFRLAAAELAFILSDAAPRCSDLRVFQSSLTRPRLGEPFPLWCH